jgi:protein ImuA
MRSNRSSAVIDDLRERIRGIETFRPHATGRNAISTGFPGFNRLLADGGLRRGTLTEWVGDAVGSGAVTLALAVAAQILCREGTFVVIDVEGEFYPVAGAQLAIPLDRTAVVRPDSPKGALWAWEQSLRCPGVAVTFGKINPTNDRAIRRLQMAVEVGGGLGFLIPPPGSSGTPWAAARICVEPHNPHASPEDQLVRRLRVRVVRGQAGSREAAVELELGHEASDVSETSELAGPMAIRKPRHRTVG